VKDRPSAIAHPTTDENAKKWGFDIIEPVGTPMAWIHDWSSAYAGWNRPMQGMMDLGELLRSMDSDLSKLEAGDVMAALCLMYRKDVFGLFDEIETEVDRETAMKIARGYGIKAGSLGWMSTQGQHGKPVPLDKIALYQDLAHTLYGPNMQPNTWFDDEKVVCSRTDCSFAPTAEKREMAAYCRTLCGGMTDGYMQCEPTLLTARLVDIGDAGRTTRCVHLWTYEPEVFDGLSEDCRANIPATTRKVLGERGVTGLER
jgi:hypothetical protein